MLDAARVVILRVSRSRLWIWRFSDKCIFKVLSVMQFPIWNVCMNLTLQWFYKYTYPYFFYIGVGCVWFLTRHWWLQMALQEQLDRFKKQQEKCQSTLTSIASKKAAANPRAVPIAAAKAPAPAVKFSNDTERLQHINSIRKGPVGAQIKRVIDLLLEVHIKYPFFLT